MSETVTKESILTRAMQHAEATKNALTTPKEESDPTPTTSRKKLIWKGLLATAAVGAVTYIAVQLLSSDDEDTETEVTPED